MLIKLDAVEEKTKGGIYLPEPAREREEQGGMTGRLIAAGPLAFHYEVDNPTIPQLGARVAFPRYSGIEQEGKDGGKYRLLKDGDLIAIIAEKQ